MPPLSVSASFEIETLESSNTPEPLTVVPVLNASGVPMAVVVTGVESVTEFVAAVTAVTVVRGSILHLAGGYCVTEEPAPNLPGKL